MSKKAPSLALGGIAERITALDTPAYKIGDVKNISLADIDVHPQVRRPISTASIKGLASVINREGQRQPVEVYFKNGRFVLVSGERRYLACKHLGRTIVEAKIIAEPNATELVYLQLTENTEHEPLTVIEIAMAVKALFDLNEKGETIAKNLNLGGRDVASRLRKIGMGSEKVHALFDEHGIADQRTLYVAAQIEAKWPQVFEHLYPQVASKTIARSELTDWLNHLKNLPDEESALNSFNAEQGAKEPAGASPTSTEGLGGASALSSPKEPLEQLTQAGGTHNALDQASVEKSDVVKDKLDPSMMDHDSEVVKQGDAQSKGKVEGEQNTKAAKKVVHTSNATPMEKHTTGDYTDSAPGDLCIEVKGKLPNGDLVNGTLMMNRVDADSAWAWVQPDSNDAQPLRFEAKKLKVVSVTAR